MQIEKWRNEEQKSVYWKHIKIYVYCLYYVYNIMIFECKRFCNAGYKSNTLSSLHAKKLNGNFDTKPVCQLHVKVFIKMPFKSYLHWEPWTWALTGYLEMELHNKQKHNGFLELTLQFSVPILLQKFIQLLNNKVHHTAVHSDISFLSLSNFRKATQHSGLGGQCSLCVSVLLNLNKSICLYFTTLPPAVHCAVWAPASGL